jgi:putative oxidoreductase
MNIIYRTRDWGDRHHPRILDIIRILLGLLLAIRGYVYFNNTGYIRELILQNRFLGRSPDVVMAIVYYSIYIQLVGGIMILLGLFTRVAAALQLPIIFGAVFFVNIFSPFFNSELWLSILVLALLILFVVIGSGPWSFDRFWEGYKTDRERKASQHK